MIIYDKRRIYGLLPDVSKEFTSDTIEVGCSHISGLCMRLLGPLAIMGIRAPRANQ